MAEEVLSALFSMNMGKSAIDFKTEEVLLPDKAVFSQNYIPIISCSSTSPKSLSQPEVIFSMPTQPLKYSLWA